MALVHATDAQFKSEVTDSKGKVLVDFWAPWCGPCQMLGPILDDLSKELADVKIVKVNVDENPETPGSFGVRGIPTMVLFNDGQAVDTKVGLLDKDSLKEWINNN